jgi:plastocyanin
VVSDKGAFNSGDPQKDGTFNFVFAQPGEYKYVCTVHPGMDGTIVVQ